jgi:hypothetical protein
VPGFQLASMRHYRHSNGCHPPVADGSARHALGSGYDRNFTKPETVRAEIDYIHANPVGRGLCQHQTALPWSSTAEYGCPGTRLLRLDQSSVPRTALG